MLRDLFFAGRALRRSPGFTIIAVLTLALGIGANTAMFSVVNSVLLRPLPGYETDKLVHILDPRGNGHLDPKAFRHIREHSKSFDQVAGLQFCMSNLTGLAEPEQLRGPCSTSNYLDLQKIQPLLGRTFLPDEDQHGRNRVVVLDHGFWQQRFGGDPGIVGKTITLNREPWRVIGVMPPDFKPLGATKPLIFIPFVMEDNPTTGIIGLARLKRGVALQEARAEMKLISAELGRLDPAEWKDVELKLEPALENLTGAQRPLLFLLMGAVSFVLLIACVNVANLSLARATGRQDEIAIRVALGASRARIARFVLAETLLLSLIASALAIAIAHLSLRAMDPLTAGLPRADELRIDGRVLGAALILGIASAVLSGIIPAFRSARVEGTAGMRGRSGVTWQGALLSGEVALAFILLTGAGLLIRSFANIRAVNLGYDPHNVLTAFLALPASDQTTAGAASFYARIRERLSTLPGVTSVATASATPAGGVMIAMDVQPVGEPEPPNARRASVNVVSEDYFRVSRIALREGRFFTVTDRVGSPSVVVVSESVAKRYFGGKAVGRSMVAARMTFNLSDAKEVPAEIVGVAGNICFNSVSNCEAEHIYLPESQDALRLNYLLVRTQGDPMALAQAVRRAVAIESPDAPLDEPRTLESRIANLTDASSRGMWLLGLFAGLAVMLAASGIYAVSAYLAEQRAYEVGIREALGARAGDIVALLCRRSFLAAIWGLAVGALAAAGLSRLIKSLLFGVSAFDSSTLALAGIGILLVAILAALGPAWRVARSSANAAFAHNVGLR
jgi:putative ABC transport system permease protein